MAKKKKEIDFEVSPWRWIKIQLISKIMKIEEILSELIKSATKVQNFVLDQAPDVIKQLLMFNFVNSIVLVVAIAITIILMNFLFVKYFVAIANACEISTPLIIVLFVNVGLFYNLYYQGMTALKIGIAPKIYLLEYAASLIK